MTLPRGLGARIWLSLRAWGRVGSGCDACPTSPRTRDPGGTYHLNLTSHFHWSALEVTVGLYTSLCQYFSEKEMMWRTEGLMPLEETSPSQAVCLTRHLTAFGASLFVPPSRVHFVFPVSGTVFLRPGKLRLGPCLQA